MRMTAVVMLMALAPGPGSLLLAEDPPAPPPQEEAPPPPAPAEVKRPEPPPAAASGVITLGDFVVAVASGLKLEPPRGGFTPESAAWALLQKGVRVRGELATPVTDADAVTVLTGLGYRIKTTTPSRVLSRDRMEVLMTTFVTQGK